MLTAIVAAGLAAGCAPAVPQTGSVPGPAGALAVVLERGTLVVATDPSYPPQSEYLPDAVRSEPTQCGSDQFTAAEFSGFDIEVAEEIALRLDVEACFVTPAWSQLIAGSWSDLWDINVGSMVITTDRMEKLYFSQPYTSGSAVLFIHSDNQTYHQPSDLSEKKIGVCTGCAYEDYLRGYLEIPGSTVQYKIDRAVPVGFETDTSALAALAKGDGVLVDAVMTDPDTGQAAIDSGLPIKQLKDVLYYDYVAVSVDKKTSRDPVPLVRRITEIIQDMHADGTLVKLSEKYYHGDFSAPAAQYDIQGLDQYD
jgi:polar amino acid transport system substrate-binding protein